MSIASLVPDHPCRGVIAAAAESRQAHVTWANDETHFTALLAADPQLFGIVASEHRRVPEALLVRKVRDAGIQNPLYVLLLGKNSDHDSIARSLNSGADQAEYWPVEERVIAAQIGAVLGRDRSDPTEILCFGGVEFNTSTGDVVGRNGRVHLTRVEGTILSALISFQQRPVSKQFLHRVVYNADGIGEQKIIDVFVYKIRKKLWSLCGREHIETVWGAGFRFVPDGFEPKLTDMRVAPHRREALL